MTVLAVYAEENVDTVVNEGAVGPVVALLTLFTPPLEPKTVASISQPLPKCARCTAGQQATIVSEGHLPGLGPVLTLIRGNLALR